MRLLLVIVTPLGLLIGLANPGSISASAPQPPRLSGRVFGPNGTPQPAAVIFAIEASDGSADDDSESRSSQKQDDHPIIRDTVSDQLGQFYFFDLPPGRYVLLAIHGHHSPGHSAPVVVGELSSPFPIRIDLDQDTMELI